MFEPDIIAGLHMMGIINQTFIAEFKNYSNFNKIESKKTSSDESLSYFQNGLALEKR